MNKFTYEKAGQVLTSPPARMAVLLSTIVSAAFAQDTVTTLASNVNTTAQTVALSLGLVVIIVGLTTAAVSRRMGVAIGACFIGGALAVAPKIYSTFQGYF